MTMSKISNKFGKFAHLLVYFTIFIYYFSARSIRLIKQQISELFFYLGYVDPLNQDGKRGRIGLTRRLAAAVLFSTCSVLLVGGFAGGNNVINVFYFYIQCNTCMWVLLLTATLLGHILSAVATRVRWSPAKVHLLYWQGVMALPLLGTMLAILGSQMGVSRPLTLPSTYAAEAAPEKKKFEIGEQLAPPAKKLEIKGSPSNFRIDIMCFGWVLLIASYCHALNYLAAKQEEDLIAEEINADEKEKYYCIYQPEEYWKCPDVDRAKRDDFTIPIKDEVPLTLIDLYNYYEDIAKWYDLVPRERPKLLMSLDPKHIAYAPYLSVGSNLGPYILLSKYMTAWMQMTRHTDQQFVQRFIYFMIGHELGHYRFRNFWRFTPIRMNTIIGITEILIPLMSLLNILSFSYYQYELYEEAACDAETLRLIPELKPYEMAEILAAKDNYVHNVVDLDKEGSP